MDNNIVAIIPARGGSKGIPRKNIIDFHGKPLLAWTIEDALQTKYIKEVFVSTDDLQIAEAASNFGAKAVLRPPELSCDNASSENALKHTILAEKLFDCEYIVFLQATSPIRESRDIDNAIEQIRNENADSLFSGSYVGEFNLWRNINGSLVSVNYDYRNRLRRQDAESQLGRQFVEDGSFYIFKPMLFLEQENRLSGKIIAYLYESWKSPQIDSFADLYHCKKVFQSKLSYKIESAFNRFQNHQNENRSKQFQFLVH
jgi:CMP-N,N'-diacetyllegionaminic acid synthase